MATIQVWVWMIFVFFIPGTCETFHIIPSANSPCPGNLTGEPCITLSQYNIINGEYKQYTSDPSEIILEFQPGHHMHTFRYYGTMFASHLVSFTMNSMNPSTIECRNSYDFRISHIQNVHIRNINFRSCGYQIESVINFSLNKSIFSQVAYHTALYIRSSSATIEACAFTNNNRMALYADNSSLFIDNSSFISNRGSKASILIENGHDKHVIISNSDFSYASSYGRYREAGALSAFTSYLELYNVTFHSNAGITGGALAVQNTESIVTISQCKFIGNSASYRGGAIYTSSSITVQQSTFSNNRVGNGRGGAIYVSGSSIYISIHLSRFLDNEVTTGAGGAVYIVGSNNSLLSNQSEFTNNRVQRPETDRVAGGAVFVSGNDSQIIIEESSLSNNKAFHTGRGGAIYTNGLNTSISISSSTMNNNSAASCGALIAINNDIQYHNMKFMIKKSLFVNNSATINSGGIMCIRNASILLLNSTFSHNRATENGGVFAVDDSKMTIQGSSFNNNTAGANGGVLNTEYFHNSLLISHTSFTHNQAAKQGGVMYLGRKGNQVKISKSMISFNNATRGGFATILGSSLQIARSDIYNNTAETGEVVSACNGDISVSDQLFSTTDPVYSVCTLISGNTNETEVTTPTTTETMVNTTTIVDVPGTTTMPTAEATIVTVNPTTSQPTDPSVTTSMYFELNGKAYPNNSDIPLSEVGENENALLCKTDLVTCCGTPPNRFGEFHYPNGDIVSVKKDGHGFYRDRGVQEVRLNRREGVISPTGKFHCAVPDASGTVRNLYIHLLSEETMQHQ